jgi:ribosome-associated protein
LKAKQIAKLAQSAIKDKKGINPVILDIHKISDVADFFVMVSGTSDRHVRTLADAVVDCLMDKNVKAHHVEGLTQSNWVLVDYGDVVVHVFHHEARKFYNLERLWGNGKIVGEKRKTKNERSTTKTRRSSAS